MTLERWSRGARTGKLSAFLLQAPSAFLLQGLQSECSLLSKPEITGLQRRGKRLQRFESSKHPLKRQLCCKHAPSSPSLARNPLLPLWLRRAAQPQRGGFSRGLGREDLDERYPSGPDTGGVCVACVASVLQHMQHSDTPPALTLEGWCSSNSSRGALSPFLAAVKLQPCAWAPSAAGGTGLTPGAQFTKPYKWGSAYKALQLATYNLQRLTTYKALQMALNLQSLTNNLPRLHLTKAHKWRSTGL